MHIPIFDYFVYFESKCVDGGAATQTSRWNKIETTWRNSNVKNAKDLITTIKQYYTTSNSDIGGTESTFEWGIDGLSVFFDNVIDNKRQQFFQETLPFIVATALQLPQLCTVPMKLLRKQV